MPRIDGLSLVRLGPVAGSAVIVVAALSPKSTKLNRPDTEQQNRARKIQPANVLHGGAQPQVHAREASEGDYGDGRRMPDALKHGYEHSEREHECGGTD
jgi:hypothetical protein